MRSAMYVPLAARGRVLGVMLLAGNRERPPVRPSGAGRRRGHRPPGGTRARRGGAAPRCARVCTGRAEPPAHHRRRPRPPGARRPVARGARPAAHGARDRFRRRAPRRRDGHGARDAGRARLRAARRRAARGVRRRGRRPDRRVGGADGVRRPGAVGLRERLAPEGRGPQHARRAASDRQPHPRCGSGGLGQASQVPAGRGGAHQARGGTDRAGRRPRPSVRGGDARPRPAHPARRVERGAGRVARLPLGPREPGQAARAMARRLVPDRGHRRARSRSGGARRPGDGPARRGARGRRGRRPRCGGGPRGAVGRSGAGTRRLGGVPRELRRHRPPECARRARAAVGDDRAAPKPRADARGDHPRDGRLRPPLRHLRPRVRRRAGPPRRDRRRHGPPLSGSRPGRTDAAANAPPADAARHPLRRDRGGLSPGGRGLGDRGRLLRRLRDGRRRMDDRDRGRVRQGRRGCGDHRRSHATRCGPPRSGSRPPVPSSSA